MHPVAARALAHFDRLFPEGAVDIQEVEGESRCATSEWLDHLDRRLTLSPSEHTKPLALDLFAGCGGLALGFEAAGFDTIGYEMDRDACATYNRNLHGRCVQDRLEVGYPFGMKPDVIIGGPPCQPFSVIGYQRGPRDDRDGFPIFLDAVQSLRPKLALVENVRGLMYRNKAYLDETLSELRRFGYKVDIRLLKATDFAVPQNRERVVIVAYESHWNWPGKTVNQPISSGTALGKLALEVPSDAKFLTPAQDRYIDIYEKKSNCIRPRDLHLDRPARTLTCRNFGASTSDMQRIRLSDGRRRMLSIREGARLQSFPDWFEFVGRESSATKQIGNAVPPLMAYELALSALESIGERAGEQLRTKLGQMEFAV